MVDTARTYAEIQTLLADNTAGDISAQDTRDAVRSALAWSREIAWGTDAERDGASGSDEFGDGSFSGWTTVQDASPTLTITEAADLLSVYHPGGDSAAEFHGIVKSRTISAGDYVEACFRGSGKPQNFNIAGVVMADGSTYGAGAQIAFYWSPNEGSGAGNLWTSDHSNWNTAGTLTDFGTRQNNTDKRLHLRLEYDAANSFKVWVSPDGVSWENLGTRARTLTPTHAGIMFTSWGGANPFIWSVPYVKFGTVS